MLASAATHAWTHTQRLRRLRQWLSDHRIAALVPVDSPAANWSICKIIRKRVPSAKIVHLAAPQLWAWATWRIHKLRRLTDHLLCLVPFEPQWFARRGVPATFVGHPLINEQGHCTVEDSRLDPPAVNEGTKLALLPGSRAGEIRANWPTMLAAFRVLRQKHTDLTALIAVENTSGAQRVSAVTQRRTGNEALLDGMALRVAQTDAVLNWCDVALVKSGTGTLQAAAHRKPMVAMYNLNWWAWHLAGRWIVRTRPLTLPNLISQANGDGPAIPELVPNLGTVEPVVASLDGLICDSAARARQVDRLEQVVSHFRGRCFAETAAERLLAMIDESSQKTSRS
jgi:lipid-A-disaccharide synthase